MKRKYTEQEIKIIEETELNFKIFRNSFDFLIEKMNDIKETKGIAEQLNSDITTGFRKNKTSNSKIEKTIIETENLSNAYENIITDIINTKIKYTQIANELKFPYGEIIFYKYIKNYTWEQVGEKIGYEREVVNRMKNKALLLFYQLQNSHIKSQKVTQK